MSSLWNRFRIIVTRKRSLSLGQISEQAKKTPMIVSLNEVQYFSLHYLKGVTEAKNWSSLSVIQFSLEFQFYHDHLKVLKAGLYNNFVRCYLNLQQESEALNLCGAASIIFSHHVSLQISFQPSLVVLESCRIKIRISIEISICHVILK